MRILRCLMMDDSYYTAVKGVAVFLALVGFAITAGLINRNCVIKRASLENQVRKIADTNHDGIADSRELGQVYIELGKSAYIFPNLREFSNRELEEYIEEHDR